MKDCFCCTLWVRAQQKARQPCPWQYRMQACYLPLPAEGRERLQAKWGEADDFVSVICFLYLACYTSLPVIGRCKSQVNATEKEGGGGTPRGRGTFGLGHCEWGGGRGPGGRMQYYHDSKAALLAPVKSVTEVKQQHDSQSTFPVVVTPCPSQCCTHSLGPLHYTCQSMIFTVHCRHGTCCNNLAANF